VRRPNSPGFSTLLSVSFFDAHYSAHLAESPGASSVGSPVEEWQIVPAPENDE
jgi:hypothetical protein